MFFSEPMLYISLFRKEFGTVKDKLGPWDVSIGDLKDRIMTFIQIIQLCLSEK